MGVNIGVVQLIAYWLRSLLTGFDQGKVLLSKHVDVDFILLISFECSEEHFDIDRKLFEASSFVSNVLDVLLFVISAPD